MFKTQLLATISHTAASATKAALPLWLGGLHSFCLQGVTVAVSVQAYTVLVVHKRFDCT